MRVLLDESLPQQLARELRGHEVQTVVHRGWAGLKNGELLPRAASEGFAAFVTADQNLEYQQNVARFGIGIVVLVARTNRLVHLLPLVPLILRALETLRPGELVRVERCLAPS